MGMMIMMMAIVPIVSLFVYMMVDGGWCGIIVGRYEIGRFYICMCTRVLGFFTRLDESSPGI